MSDQSSSRTEKYDLAAPAWGDKMRALGYFDGYMGFLGTQAPLAQGDLSVTDVGAGSGSFAEAWVVIHGAPGAMTLLDPSQGMLHRAQAALHARGVAPRLVRSLLGAQSHEPVDVLLAAHVIEHCPDPAAALAQMHAMLRPGGRLFLVVSKPHWCNAIIWLQWRQRTFGKAEITKLVSAAGFGIEQHYAFPTGPPSRTSRGIIARRPL
ncbi:MAG: class I SAM-dependent methyltransferase [Pseudomonadota bacterium]